MANMKKNKGITLAELLIAFAVCGVIFVISIQSFKSIDVRRTPYIYSVMTNLPLANDAIAVDCYEEGTCKTKNVLPDSRKEYCTRLAAYFNVTGNTNCTGAQDSETTENIKRRVNADDKYFDFKLPNGIAFYGIHQSAWGRWGGSSHGHLSFAIDINGNSGPNRVGEDVFPIYMSREGEIAPGLDTTFAHDADGSVVHNNNCFFDNSTIFGYRVLSHEYVNNSLETKVVDTRTIAERTTTNGKPHTKFKIEPISFRDALCYAYGKKEKDHDSSKSKAEEILFNMLGGEYDECNGINRVPKCAESGVTCTIEPYKPKSPGFVRLFGIE